MPCSEPPLLCGQGFKTCECVDPGCTEMRMTDCAALCVHVPLPEPPICDPVLGISLQNEECNNFDEDCDKEVDENLSQAFIHILNENVVLVEKKSDFKVLRKKESSSKEEGKSTDKSDDPIRMYLREMGGVELLSREGEIAIAKRIEAGKDVMLNALSQSPITAQQFFEWNQKLQNDEILVREIIDLSLIHISEPTRPERI